VHPVGNPGFAHNLLSLIMKHILTEAVPEFTVRFDRRYDHQRLNSALELRPTTRHHIICNAVCSIPR
jgi:hypothetical protein